MENDLAAVDVLPVNEADTIRQRELLMRSFDFRA